jgi:hypothetical protein
MTHGKWYPAAALSVVVLGCGGSAENGSRASTGGTTSIDTGVPTNTTGGFGAYYGMLLTGGAYATGGYGGYVSPGTGGALWGNTGGAYDIGTGGAFARLLPICTPGADQTCNDNPQASSIMGQCNSDTTCTCNDPYITNYVTGKCNTYEQTVCYSPTQNIDQAYVDRAFGCICDSATTPPFCGLDSSGLRVYLECANDNWESGDTSNCSGSDPKVCFSPTKNVSNALATNAIGCSCDTATSSTHCVQTPAEADAGTTALDAGATTQTLMFTCSNGKWKAVAGGSCT